MNKQRRKMIAEVVEKIETLKGDLEMIRDEEQDAFDNMPEGLQYSARGAMMEVAIDQMDEAIEGLDTAIDSLRGVE